ncbi:MAG: TIGR01777 family oxidoreductase [Candidatus Omnitrophota bacterium]
MPLKIAISGSTGLVGTAVSGHFKAQNAEIIPVVRSVSQASSAAKTIVMDIKHQTIDTKGLEGLDAVIHLAGANIAGQRWDDAYKTEILLSRVESTKLISNALARVEEPPKVFICASAIGWYGNGGADKEFVESDLPAMDFLGDVCHQWETATQTARERGIRVVTLRIGAVLSRKGGAVEKMWVPFSLGLGGRLGDGKQMFSWIALDEIPLIIDFIIRNELILGPVNVTAPNPVTNAEFTRVFGKVIKRPVIFPVPAFGARLMFGEMADALLLNGARVVPKKLTDAGYKFKYDQVEAALRASLK